MDRVPTTYVKFVVLLQQLQARPQTSQDAFELKTSFQKRADQDLVAPVLAMDLSFLYRLIIEYLS